MVWTRSFQTDSIRARLLTPYRGRKEPLQSLHPVLLAKGGRGIDYSLNPVHDALYLAADLFHRRFDVALHN